MGIYEDLGKTAVKTVVVYRCPGCLRTVRRDDTLLVSPPRGRPVIGYQPKVQRVCRDCYSKKTKGDIMGEVRRLGLPEKQIEEVLRFTREVKEGGW